MDEGVEMHEGSAMSKALELIISQLCEANMH
jgi:hypothetical protein